jgi:hypothetical protein
MRLRGQSVGHHIQQAENGWPFIISLFALINEQKKEKGK